MPTATRVRNLCLPSDPVFGAQNKIEKKKITKKTAAKLIHINVNAKEEVNPQDGKKTQHVVFSFSKIDEVPVENQNANPAEYLFVENEKANEAFFWIDSYGYISGHPKMYLQPLSKFAFSIFFFFFQKITHFCCVFLT